METMDTTTTEILASIERLRQFTVDFRLRHREWAQGQPQTKHCDRHQRNLPIDWDRACRESMSEREFILVYQPCPACKREEEMLRESGWLHERGVPLVLCHARFRNFTARRQDDTRALEAAEKFSRRKAGFFILSGSVGAGKSHLAVAIMRERRAGLFMKHSALLEGIRKTYRDRSALDPVEACKRAKFLVLDDLGSSSGGEDDGPALHAILDHRHEEKLPTVITSNLSQSLLAAKVGPRMFDRIRDGLFRWIELVGPSRRGEAPYAD